MIAFWNNCPILKLNYRGISKEDESHSSMLTRTKCSRISHLLSFMRNTNSRVPRKICQGPLCHNYMCQRTLSCTSSHTHTIRRFTLPNSWPSWKHILLDLSITSQHVPATVCTLPQSHETKLKSVKNTEHSLKLKWFNANKTRTFGWGRSKLASWNFLTKLSLY